MIVHITKRVINYRIPFSRYLASGCSFHDLNFSLSDWNLNSNTYMMHMICIPCCFYINMQVVSLKSHFYYNLLTCSLSFCNDLQEENKNKYIKK